MLLQSFPSGPLETNAFVIGCRETKKAAIVDPAPGSLGAIIDWVTSHSLQVDLILLTHSHWDHIGDVAAAKTYFKAPLAMHEADQGNVIRPGADGLPCWITIAPAHPDKFLHDGDLVEIGTMRWQVIHTPGHSPGSICFFCKEQLALFTGDTLFKGSYGNLSLPTAEPQRMAISLRRLASLPPETIVWAGHGAKTSIADELPWLSKI